MLRDREFQVCYLRKERFNSKTFDVGNKHAKLPNLVLWAGS